MSDEQKRAIAIANSGRGLTRVEIATRALERAQAEVVACQQRLQVAIMNEGKSADNRSRRDEKNKAKLASLLQADVELQEQARRILAQLDESVTIAG